MSADFLSVSGMCRDMRHAWDLVGDYVLIEDRRQVRHFTRTLECMRCGTRRIDEFKMSSVALTRLRSRYQYPTGYRIPGGMAVADVRMAMLKNVVMIPKETP